jgi:hypothetical protein
MEIVIPKNEGVIDAIEVINVLANVLNSPTSQFEFLKSRGFEITQAPLCETITTTNGHGRNDMHAKGVIFKIENPNIGIKTHVKILNGISTATDGGSFSSQSSLIITAGFTLNEEFFSGPVPEKLIDLAFKIISYMQEHLEFYNSPKKILAVAAMLIMGLEPKWFKKNQLDKIKRYFPGLTLSKHKMIEDKDRQQFVEIIKGSTFGNIALSPIIQPVLEVQKEKEKGAGVEDLFEKLQREEVERQRQIEEDHKLALTIASQWN